jgi:ubiquitin thioesterase protein OTUB1
MEENRPSDEEILRYERMLKEQDHSPLVSNLLDFSALEAEYYDGLPIYKSKIRYLQSSCLNMRTVKKDGNCFYRAFAFRFCELLRQNYGLPLYDELLKRARESKLILQAMSYDMSILEDFWEPFEQVLTNCDEDNLLERFCTEHVSDTIVCYLRLVTAALLKRDSEIYEAFVLDSFPSLEMFVSSCVEPSSTD